MAAPTSSQPTGDLQEGQRAGLKAGPRSPGEPREGVGGSEPLISHIEPPVGLSCSWWSRMASSALHPLLLPGSTRREGLILDKSPCEKEDVKCSCNIPIREGCMQQSYLLHTPYFSPAAGKRISCCPLNHQCFLPGCFKHSFIITYTNFWRHCYFFVREDQS